MQRLRGAIGIGIAWAVIWAAAFTALGVVISLLDPDSIDPGESVGLVLRIGATLGLVSGAGFSGLLALAEGGRRIEELSLPRMALWGAVATAAFPLLTPANNAMVILLCPLGAIVAAGSVAIARRGSLRAGPTATVALPRGRQPE